jgi:hypothetical protein
MKLKRFNELNERKNIFNLNESYNIEKYDCVVKEDISEIISFFLEDLEGYNNDNDIQMNEQEIQKAIDIIKSDYLKKGTYYSEKEKYEEITGIDSHINGDEYFNNIIEIIK